MVIGSRFDVSVRHQKDRKDYGDDVPARENQAATGEPRRVRRMFVRTN